MTSLLHHHQGFSCGLTSITTIGEATDDTAYRMVRTLFDKRNRPDANLVLGDPSFGK